VEAEGGTVRKSRTGQEAEEMGVQDGLPANLEAQAIKQMVPSDTCSPPHCPPAHLVHKLL
jgi:hypothetical protein